MPELLFSEMTGCSSQSPHLGFQFVGFAGQVEPLSCFLDEY
jgi:hypothetical protein